MGKLIRTVIDLDLSKIQKLSSEEIFNKINGSIVREMVKVSFSLHHHEIQSIYFESSEEEASTPTEEVIPQSIKIYLLSKEPLGFSQKNDSVLSEEYTLLPVHYQIEEIEGVIEDFPREIKNTSKYLSPIISNLDLSITELDKISQLMDVSCEDLTLDEKIKEALANQELRKRIELKYPFFHQAIQAYESNNLHSTRPEAWPVKSILSIVRSNYCDELILFSVLCLRIQYERSHGAMVPNILTDTLQEEPLHIGLFDTYQMYLDLLENIVNRMSIHQSMYWKECLNLFEGLSHRLKAFMQSQLKEPSELSSLRQNAWINVLLQVKDFFQSLEYFLYREEFLQGTDPLEWEPYLVETSSSGDFFYKSESMQYPIHFSLTKKEMKDRLKIFLHDKCFNIETYMDALEKEVSQGVYTFVEKTIFAEGFLHVFQENLEPLNKEESEYSFVSGVGCHFEVSEELTERDLILMSYTSLTPIGNFKSFRAFHDGHWRSSAWLRTHDAYHSGKHVRTFERMGIDLEDFSIDRYLKINKMSNCLEVIHKILTLSESESLGLSEAEKNYIRLHLFMIHELSFNASDSNLEILDIDALPLASLRDMDVLSQMQDLLHSMKIKIEAKDETGKVQTILPGDYELNALIAQAHSVYLKVKQDAFIEYINEKLLIAKKEI